MFVSDVSRSCGFDVADEIDCPQGLIVVSHEDVIVRIADKIVKGLGCVGGTKRRGFRRRCSSRHGGTLVEFGGRCSADELLTI